MLAVSWVIAFFSFATCVLSLKMDLTPKERNVTQGQTRKFKYQPANDTVSQYRTFLVFRIDVLSSLLMLPFSTP
jgi:hypothetical protein